VAPPVEEGAFFGDYELLRKVAQGGMGVVFQARQQTLSRVVALKMILAGRLATEAEVRRFRAEAEAAARLDHPGIVPIYEVGEHAGHHFFAMGFVEGGSLADRLKGGPLPPREAAKLIEQVARAVAYAHERGIVHRDLKPANVLLDRDGRPRVTDFGLARMLAGEAHLTVSGQVVGTPSYMPPEQAAGKSEQIGPAADVYALGATLYCLLTGRPPFQAASVLETLKQVLEREPVPPRQLNAAVPRDLETVCLKCLEKEPARRYAGAEALAADLAHFLAGEPIQARPVGQAERLWRWCRRNPALAGALSALLLALSAGTAISTLFALQADDRARGEAEARSKAEAFGRRASKDRYVSDMRLVPGFWESGQADLARELLERQRPEHNGGFDWRHFEWYYWDRCCQKPLRTITPSDGKGLLFFEMSAGGTRFATQSTLPTRITVWDAGTGKQLFTVPEEAGRCLALSPDGSRLVYGGPDNCLKVWDLAGRRRIHSIKGHAGQVGQVAFSPDGCRFASAGEDGVAKVWDAVTGQSLATFKGHSGALTGVAFHPKGDRVVTCGYKPGSVKVWNAATGQEILNLTDCGRIPTGVAYSPDGRRIAGWARTGQKGMHDSVRLWDAETGKVLSIWNVRAESHHTLRPHFSPDGKWLLTAENQPKVYDAADGRVVATLSGHLGQLGCARDGAQFGPDGKTIYTADDNGTIRVWDTARVLECSDLEASPEIWILWNQGMGLSPDGRRAATTSAGKESAIRVWDLEEGKELLKIPMPQNYAWTVAFSPDGSTIAGPCLDGRVRGWEASTGKELFTLPGHKFGGRCVAFTPDGSRLVSGGTDNALRVWDLREKRQVLAISHTGEVGRVAVSPDGTRFATVCDGKPKGHCFVWDAAEGRKLLEIDGHRSGTTDLVFSSDGRWLLTANDKTLKLWDADTGQEVRTFEGHKDSVNSVSITADGERIVSGGYDGVKVWDTATGQEVVTFQESQSTTRISRDGRRVVSISAGGTALRIWDATPRRQGP
jgi:WD40 repeat protein/tRNA A-37 threonylcarbamoyl transferase component Bud32